MVFDASTFHDGSSSDTHNTFSRVSGVRLSHANTTSGMISLRLLAFVAWLLGFTRMIAAQAAVGYLGALYHEADDAVVPLLHTLGRTSGECHSTCHAC